MGNLGLFIKSEDKCRNVCLGKCNLPKWTDLKARESIWEEALAELIADAFEDEWDDDYEEEEAPVKAKAPVKEEPKPAAEPADGDDPDVNPYSS